MENWQYHATYSRIPQGGIVSPILANIYLNELDKRLEAMQTSSNKAAERQYTPEYSYLHGRKTYLARCIKRTTGEKREMYMTQWKAAHAKLLRTPSKSQTDKKICYVRYEDDFLIA
jgi:retron-type reverse transcriptase